MAKSMIRKLLIWHKPKAMTASQKMEVENVNSNRTNQMCRRPA